MNSLMLHPFEPNMLPDRPANNFAFETRAIGSPTRKNVIISEMSILAMCLRTGSLPHQ